jgi:hypothetical protein
MGRKRRSKETQFFFFFFFIFSFFLFYGALAPFRAMASPITFL